jgi:hypothetical protein
MYFYHALMCRLVRYESRAIRAIEAVIPRRQVAEIVLPQHLMEARDEIARPDQCENTSPIVSLE